MGPGVVVADRFEIERLAGAGGMGTVYSARDRRSGARVALKVLLPHAGAEAERFEREARVLSDLTHPGIVRYVDHGSADGTPYLAMEWLEGEDLSVRVARGPLSVEDTLALAARLASALAAAHARGVIHRDIKPSNVLLTGGAMDGAKILDFGIARLSQGARSSTRTGVALGTPGYMAPEQARGERDVGPRADVFAFGSLLFECLTGEPAFSGDHVIAILAKILLEDPRRVRDLRPDVPVDLDRLVDRMLAKDPHHRPADGAAIVEELGALCTDAARTVADAPPSITRGEQRFVSIVAAALGAASSEPANPLAPTLADEAPSLPPLEELSARWGARFEVLRDGSIVATLVGAGSATDRAAQAARCALALREALPSGRVVLTTGRGVVEARLPMGDAIDRAAGMLRRSAKRAPAVARGPVEIDAVTAALLDARFELARVREGAGPDESLELLGERASFEAVRTLLGRERSCVGRQRELETLGSLLHESLTEPVSRAVLVTGPAGIGKSRVRQELTRSIAAETPRAEVWQGRADPMSAGSAFGLIASALRHMVGLTQGEPREAARDKLVRRFARSLGGDALARVSEFLGELVGVPFPDVDRVELRAARQDKILMGDQLRRAWEDLLAAECAVRPVVLVLEDLHWGDVATVKLVDAALRNLQAAPFFVLALARQEVHELFPRLWADRRVQEVRLEPLSRKESARLAREVLGEGASPATIDLIAERAGGNAFFLEEIIRAVAEGESDALPETVLAMVEARLAGLTPEARRVLRAASVFGEVFSKEGVASLVGALAVGPRLDELLDRELVTKRRRDDRAGELAFRHALVREAAYAMLTPEDRKLGHRLAAAWLERSGQLDALALAEHFERGDEPLRAVAFYLRASEQALEGNDFDAAIARAERGVVCGAEGEVKGALRLVQTEAYHWRGNMADVERAGLEALELLPRASAGWHRAVGEVVLTRSRLGKVSGVIEVAEALVRAGPVESSARAVALAMTARQLLLLGEVELGREVSALLDAATAEVLADPATIAHERRLRARWSLLADDAGAFLEHVEAARAAFERAGDKRSACEQHGNLGFAMLELGAPERAEHAIRESLAAAARMGLKDSIPMMTQNLSLALARQGKLDAARAEAEAAVRAYRAIGNRRMQGASQNYLALVLTLAGDFAGAEGAARAAEQAARDVAWSVRGHALGVLARALLSQGRAAEALDAAREAMSIVTSRGRLEEGEAFVRLVHVEALAASGDLAAANDALAAARERLFARADRIKDPVWRASFLERVPENARTLAIDPTKPG